MIDTTATPASPTQRNFNLPPAVLLMGPPGSGKTFSLTTALLHPSVERLVVLGTEPRFHESIYDSATKLGIPLDKIATRLVEPARMGMAGLLEVAGTISALTYEGLAGIKAGLQKPRHQQWLEMLRTMLNFVDERTGEVLGPVEKFPESWMFAIDGLTGLNIMARGLTVGAKPTLAQGEWGVAMTTEEQFLNECSSSIKCFFTLLAHVGRERDEITGGTKVYVDALGNKLGPRIPTFFSEVVTAKNEGGQYYWSTNEHGYDLKRRSLPIGAKLEPDFRPIIEAWRRRNT